MRRLEVSLWESSEPGCEEAGRLEVAHCGIAVSLEVRRLEVAAQAESSDTGGKTSPPSPILA